jgi:hypothetical protein
MGRELNRAGLGRSSSSSVSDSIKKTQATQRADSSKFIHTYILFLNIFIHTYLFVTTFRFILTRE